MASPNASPHEDTCPACQDFALYRDDRQAWYAKHPAAWVREHAGKSEQEKRQAWREASPEIRAAVKELTCTEPNTK